MPHADCKQTLCMTPTFNARLLLTLPYGMTHENLISDSIDTLSRDTDTLTQDLKVVVLLRTSLIDFTVQG